VPPGREPELSDPDAADEQDENSSGHRADEQGQRERDVAGRTEELHLYPLAVLGDEDDEQDQEDQRRDQRQPDSSGSGALRAGQGITVSAHARALPL
jgi:hypothetical protein